MSDAYRAFIARRLCAMGGAPRARLLPHLRRTRHHVTVMEPRGPRRRGRTMATLPGRGADRGMVREVRASRRAGWIIRSLFLAMAAVPLAAATTILAEDPAEAFFDAGAEFHVLLPPGHPPVGCGDLPPGHPRVDLDRDDDLQSLLPPGHPPVGSGRLPVGHPHARRAPEGLELFPQDGVTRI